VLHKKYTHKVPSQIYHTLKLLSFDDAEQTYSQNTQLVLKIGTGVFIYLFVMHLEKARLEDGNLFLVQSDKKTVFLACSDWEKRWHFMACKMSVFIIIYFPRSESEFGVFLSLKSFGGQSCVSMVTPVWP